MSNLSYEPGEERRGVLATLGVISALVLLGFVLIAASPSPRSEVAGGTDETNGVGGTGDGGGEGAAPPAGGSTSSGAGGAPRDLSWVCDRGFGLQPVDLSAEERDGVQEQVERFILTAYGDPGNDASAYERRVEELVVPGCFTRSLAGGYVNDVEEIARAGGKESASSDPYSGPTFARELVHFEIQGARETRDTESDARAVRVVGTAVWVSERSDGSPRAWEEYLTLVRGSSGEWKVLSGETIPQRIDPKYYEYLPSGVEG